MKKIAMLIVILSTFAFPWNVLETENAYIVYPDGFKEHALEVAELFENLRDGIVEDFGNDPGKITILIEDGGTYMNAFADVLTRNITLLTWPQASVWLNFSDLYKTLIIHEFTHIVHLTKENGFNKFITDLTGFPLFNPQIRSPFVEAVTVFEESKYSKSSGRLNNPFLDSLVRSYARSWRYSLAGLEKPPNYWFLSGTSYYIVSASFLEHLVEEKEWDTFRSFLDDYSFKISGVGLDSSFKKYYGDSMGNIYEKWLDSIGKDFKVSARKVLEIDNIAITEIETDGKDVYFKATIYGYDSLIGKSRVFIGKLNGDGFEKVFDSNLPIGKFIPTEDGVYYTVRFSKEEFSPGFWRYTTRLEFLKKGSNSPEKIYEGYISDFDVNGDDIYIAIYDPKTRISEILKNESPLFSLKGFVRDVEIVDGKIYMLVMEDGRSSDLLVWDGDLKVLAKDPRFKYSLKECGEDVCFSMFDNNANVYRISDGKLFRITDGIVAGDFAVVGAEVYFSAFSDSRPSIGIYKTTLKAEESNFIPAPNGGSTMKDVRVKRSSYTDLFLKDMVCPDIRLPYVLHDGTSLILGIGFVEASPDYKFSYILSPFYVSNRGFGVGILSNLLLPGNLTIRGYLLKPSGAFDLSDMASISLSWKKFLAFNPWTNLWIVPNLEISHPFDVKFGLALSGRFGSVSLSSRTEFSTLKIEGSQRFGVSFPVLSSRLSLNFDLDFPDMEFEISLENEFPVLHLDLGLYDPLFHIGDIFTGGGVSYDGSFSVRAFLKVDFSQFLTYSRSFLKIGVSYKEGNLSPVFEISANF